MFKSVYRSIPNYVVRKQQSHRKYFETYIAVVFIKYNRTNPALYVVFLYLVSKTFPVAVIYFVKEFITRYYRLILLPDKEIKCKDVRNLCLNHTNLVSFRSIF